jgi:DNA-binding transcriptional regulator YdaS (Cro superfamily)
MTLDEYFKTDVRGAKAEMAEYLGITATWMALLIARRRKPSVALAIAIETATGGLVTRQELRPDIWQAA